MQNRAILFLIAGFFRLGPLGLGIIAALIMGAGYYLQVLDNQRMAREAQALTAGIPQLVDLADAPKAATLSVVDEVHVQAQLVWDHSYDLWYEENYGTDYVVMYPLIDPNSPNLSNVIGVALFQAENDSFDTISTEIAEAWYVADGKFGPIMNLNGELGGMGKWQGLVEESFFDEGLQMPADPVVIWPYVEGRDVALAPREPGTWTIFGVLSKIAGVIGLFALGKIMIRRAPDDDLPDPAMESPDLIVSSPQGNGVPLWKRQSELATQDHFADETPEPDGHSFIQQPEPGLDPPEAAKFGLRKVLIAVVGGLFLLGLAAVASDLINQSAPVEMAASQQDTIVANIADAVVPDADPNRHWTDIDVTPIVEWFVAKGMLALGGDVEAQITLGSIFGGLVFALFMLRFFFSMRRSLAPKTTARFDSMGIN